MAYLEALLREQVAHAYENAPALRHLMEQAGVLPQDIQTLADLAQIPVLSKDKIQQMQQANPPFGGLLAVPVHHLRRVFVSPGPIYDPQGFTEEALWECAEEAILAANLSEEDVTLNTFMYHLVPAGLIFEEAMHRVGVTVIPMGPGNIEMQIKAMLDLPITAYMGTPSFLEMIYEKAKTEGIGPLPLKKAFFSAEMYTPAQRAFFEGECGLITAQAYATAEMGLIAYERPGQSGLYVPQQMIVQVCSPETGEPLPEGQLGEVVVTTFNRAYPILRFGTGDLSILESETDADGHTRSKLLGLMGRSGEAIKVRGMFLHPNAIRKGAAAFRNIKKIQAVIGREGSRDTIALQVVLNEGDLDTHALATAVSQAARLSVDQVQIVEQIEGTRTVRDTRTF
jgi:phenylacetate-CoA ligase